MSDTKATQDPGSGGQGQQSGEEERKETGNACDYCRRLKMRCSGKENPPCQRCRTAKKPCTFGMEGKAKPGTSSQAIDKRLQGLEEQMGWIQQSLSTFLQGQQSQMQGQGQGQGPPPMGLSQRQGYGQGLPGQPGSSYAAVGPGGGGGAGFGQGPGGGVGIGQGQGHGQGFHPSLSMGPPSWDQGYGSGSVSNHGNGAGGDAYMSMRYGSDNVSQRNSIADPSPPIIPSPHSIPSGPNSGPSSARPFIPPFPGPSGPIPTSAQTLPPMSTFPPARSIRSRGTASPDAHPLADIPLRSLASRLDVARLVADGHVVEAEDDGPRSSDEERDRDGYRDSEREREGNGQGPGSRGVKRARFEERERAFSTGDAARMKAEVLSPERHAVKAAVPRPKGDLARTFGDPVDLGVCSDAEGRKLVELYFAACHSFIPVYDPQIDTWDSLRHRSPFSVSVLMMIGKRVEDAGGPTSGVQVKCKENAELIGKSMVFSPVANIEALQALIVMSCWGDTVWRPGRNIRAHVSDLAFSIAVDMGLYRCLPYLVETGMGAGRTPDELEEERSLVIGARVWLALYKLRYEMAYNHGRPILMTDDDTLSYARRFLSHPLSHLSDSRLVASCELLSLRIPLHQPLSYRPSAEVEALDARLMESDRGIEEWFKHWDRYYDSIGMLPGHFLRESLISQMCHAILYANMRVLYNVGDRKSAAMLSEPRRRRVEDAVRAAQRLIDITLRGKDYKTSFRYDLGVAFTARNLIRLASLFPDIVDLKQASKDLEQLVTLLSQVPEVQTGQMIEEVLRRARRRQVLPPLSKPPSPRHGYASIPPNAQVSGSGKTIQPYSAARLGSMSNGMGMGRGPGPGAGQGVNEMMGYHQSQPFAGVSTQQGGPGTGPSPIDAPSAESQPLFDFGLAEELLTTGGGGAATQQSASADQNFDQLFDPSVWFPLFHNSDLAMGMGSGAGAGTGMGMGMGVGMGMGMGEQDMFGGPGQGQGGQGQGQGQGQMFGGQGEAQTPLW